MANAELKIIISAVNNAAKILMGLEKDIMDVEKASKAGGEFLQGMGVSIDGLANPALMAGKAVGFLVDTVKQGVANFADYGKEVESVSRKLGITAEEASKLIQVSDDLEVDYSVLTQVMKEGLKDGIVPSIDGIADLAKEYQAIADPAKRAAFATEKFGRAGLEMQKMLEVAPEQLKAMGEAVGYTGLMMDEEGVKAAKEYRLAVDALADSWDGMVARTMPAVVKGLTAVNNTVSGSIAYYDLIAEAQERGIKLDYKRSGSGMALAETTESLIAKLKAYDDGLKLSAIAQEAFRDGERGLPKIVDDHKEAELRLAEQLDRRNSAMGEVKTSTELATAAGLAMYNQDVLAADAMSTYTAALLYNKVAQNLDADAALSLATQMGLVDERTRYAMTRVQEITKAFDTNKDGIVTADEGLEAYIATIAGLNKSIADLPSDVYVNFHLTTEGSVPNVNVGGKGGGGASQNLMRAAGGPVADGASYIVGERGPELFTPSQAGSITPNHITNHWGGINISGGGMNPQDIARAIGREFDRRR